jgi:catechol 2,3-dioxygenase
MTGPKNVSKQDMMNVSSVPPAIGLYEMVLETADLTASERFYHDVLGFEVVERWGGERPALWLALGRRSFLGLWSPAAGGEGAIHHGRGGAHVHFAIRVPTGALDAYEQRFMALSVPYERHNFGNEVNQGLYLDDPDGNVVELSDFAVLWDGSDGTT